MPTFHNWRGISALEDPRTRMVLSLTPTEQIPEAFLDFFPECFAEEEQPPYIPLSALMKGARKYAKDNELDEEDEAHFVLTSAEAAAPHLYLQSSHEWGTEEGDDPPPDDVLKQLVGKEARAGILVEIDGELHLVTLMLFKEGPPPIGSVFRSLPEPIVLHLCPAKFVALDR